MVAPLCCECRMAFPLSNFAPRDNTVFEDESREPLPSGEIWRQPRCGPCNAIYGRRRRFVDAQLVPLARSLGLTFKQRNRSAFRTFEVVHPCAKAALRAIEERIQDFNDSLPVDRPASMHGIRLVHPRTRTNRFTQGTLPLLASTPSEDDAGTAESGVSVARRHGTDR